MRKIKYFIGILMLGAFLVILSSCGDSIKEFKFTDNYVTLDIGDEKNITSIKNNGEISYFSGDESVVTVDNNGLIKAVGVGSAPVYALFKNQPYRCQVKVLEKIEETVVYQNDANLNSDIDIPILGNINIKLPAIISYNTKDELMDFNDFRFELKIDLMKAPETKDGDKTITSSEQVKKNISTINTVLSLVKALVNIDIPTEVTNYFDELNNSLSSKSGETLDNQIKEYGEQIIYVYLSKDYRSFGIFDKETTKYYIYSNASDGGIVNAIIKFISLAKNIDLSEGGLQKIDVIGLTKGFSGDLISDELLEKLRTNYDGFIETFNKIINLVEKVGKYLLGNTQVNKSNIDNDENQVRLAFRLLDSGIEALNTEISTTPVGAIMRFKSVNANADFYRDVTNYYNHFKGFDLNAVADLAGNDVPLSFSFGLGKARVATSGAFSMASNHAKYEADMNNIAGGTN